MVGLAGPLFKVSGFEGVSWGPMPGRISTNSFWLMPPKLLPQDAKFYCKNAHLILAVLTSWNLGKWEWRNRKKIEWHGRECKTKRVVEMENGTIRYPHLDMYHSNLPATHHIQYWFTAVRQPRLWKRTILLLSEPCVWPGLALVLWAVLLH